jgi:hypothetical protein
MFNPADVVADRTVVIVAALEFFASSATTLLDSLRGCVRRVSGFVLVADYSR